VYEDERDLKILLTQVFVQALNTSWDAMAPYFRAIAADLIQYRPTYHFTDIITDAIDAAVKQAVSEHLETFRPVVDELARKQAETILRKRLKARGLSTDLLDTMDGKDAQA